MCTCAVWEARDSSLVHSPRYEIGRNYASQIGFPQPASLRHHSNTVHVYLCCHTKVKNSSCHNLEFHKGNYEVAKLLPLETWGAETSDGTGYTHEEDIKNSGGQAMCIILGYVEHIDFP